METLVLSPLPENVRHPTDGEEPNGEDRTHEESVPPVLLIALADSPVFTEMLVVSSLTPLLLAITLNSLRNLSGINLEVPFLSFQ